MNVTELALAIEAHDTIVNVDYNKRATLFNPLVGWVVTAQMVHDEYIRFSVPSDKLPEVFTDINKFIK